VSAAADHLLPTGNGSGVVEDEETFARGLPHLQFGRVRHVGAATPELRRAAAAAEVDVIDEPVVVSGRLEMRWYLREQAISRTLHRFGNLIGGDRRRS
jgi:RHH-type proline utilization regulon transcriptional repressor/proline dehydrogenase/delta 1-pyrroline-5-carboxylate dehydrogenase